VAKLINSVPDISGKRILDIATGKAVTPSALMKANVNVQKIIGLDITYRMLELGKQKISANGNDKKINFLCGSAMEIPIQDDYFDIVICGLATHHMDVRVLLTEMKRVLKNKGHLSIADVGGSRKWKHPVVRFLIKTGAFLYFLVVENLARAWAEASALPNIHTSEEWHVILNKLGFIDIEINELQSKKFWTPNPILIQANKPT